MKPTLPALDHVTALPLLLRATIPDEYKDENNHMNVRWYLALFDEAGYPMIERVGVTPAYREQYGAGGFDLEHHLHYLNEVHVGDQIAIYVRFLARSAKRIHYIMFMVNETRKALAATFECVNSFADLRQRRTAPFPPEIAVKIDALLAQHNALDWAAPVCGLMGA